MTRPTPPLTQLLSCSEGSRDVQAMLDDEVRRLAHAEWLRTGNPDEFHNWHEGEKQLGGRLIHTGTVQWLYRELSSKDKQLAECSVQVKDLEARCTELKDCTALTRESHLREWGGTDVANSEAKLAAREALLRGEIAAEQAKLTVCEAKIQELEPAYEAQTATLAQRSQHLTECNAYVQTLQETLQRQTEEVNSSEVAEARCQDLESAIEAKQAELATRDEQLRQQGSQLGHVQAWLEQKREDLSRGLAQLEEKGQQIMELEAAHAAAKVTVHDPSQAHEARVRSLQSELSERERRLSSERAKVGKLEAIEEDLRKELSASMSPPDLKPWEGQRPEMPLGSEASWMSSREELSLQREEMIVRDKSLAQREAQTQALSSLLRARRAELDARGSQLQAVQAQLAARERRLREQDTRARQLEKQRADLHAQLKAHRSEVAAGREELEVRSRGCILQEERAAEECEAQCEHISTLKAQLQHQRGEIAEQLATERALVSHGARLREVEESLVEACDRKVAQQEAQVQALSSLLKARTAELEAKGGQLEAQSAQLEGCCRRLVEQEEQHQRFYEARGALHDELQAEARMAAEADEVSRESRACAEESRACAEVLTEALQANREELAASEAEIQSRDTELAALRAAHGEQLAGYEERLEALMLERPEETGTGKEVSALEVALKTQHEEIMTLEAKLRFHEMDRYEELCAEQRTGSSLCKLEERLAQSLAKVRMAAEVSAEARQAAAGRSRAKQAAARAFLTIRGIDYSLLCGLPTVLVDFRQVLQRVIAAEAGHGVQTFDVSLELWAGSVVVCATITLPPGVSAGAVEAQLRFSTTLCRAVADEVSKVEGIEQVTVGALSVIVHNVRPEARTGGSTPEDVNHRGISRVQDAPSPSALPEPRGIARLLSVLTPSRRWGTQPPQEKTEEGTVRKIVRELEAKAEVLEDSSEGGGAELKKATRPCFRTRAYSQRDDPPQEGQ